MPLLASKEDTMRTALVRLWLLTLVMVPPVLAGSGGSSYSVIGIGDLRYTPGATSAGMGYTGIGLVSANALNPFAPATWSRINRTRFEGSALYEGFNSTDGINSRYLARMDFGGAVLAVPFAPRDGIVWVSGLVPYSNVNYDTYASGKFTGGIDTLSYTIDYNGTGGVSRAFTGLSIQPFMDLAFGFSVNYHFSSIDIKRTLTSPNPDVAGGIEVATTSFQGLTYTIGGLFNGFDRISPWMRAFSLGFFVTSRGVLGSETQTIYRYAPDRSNERDTLVGAKGSISLPLCYGVGVAFQASDRFVLAADYVSQAWASSEVNGATPANIRDSYRIGVGAERTPSLNINDPWRERVALRLGGYYNATYYSIDGQGIDEYGATAGLGFPLTPDTRLNFSVDYALRGTTQNGLTKDNIWRLTVTLTIGELWFQHFEEE
jgi:hypothetical protein